MSDMSSVEVSKHQPKVEQSLAAGDCLKAADATTLSRLKNLVPEKARHALRLSAQKAVLAASGLYLLLSSGCGNIDNAIAPPLTREPTPASVAQRQETGRVILESRELPEGSCVLEDKGNGVYELTSGTKSPTENSYNKDFSDVLQSLGYSSDDPRVVFIQTDNGVGKGYAITPDLVLTVNHVAGATQSIYNRKLSNVKINPYDKELAIDDKYATGDVVTLLDAWKKSKISEGSNSSMNNSSRYDEGLTFLILGTGNEVNDPFTTGTPVATIKGQDIVLIKLNSPLPNIKGTVRFKDSYAEGTRVTIRRAPSERLFIRGVVSSDRFTTASLQTHDKAEAERFLEDLPGGGTSGSVVIDENGNIIGAVNMGFVGKGGNPELDNVLLTVKSEFSSGATPSGIIEMVKNYCDSTRNR